MESVGVEAFVEAEAAEDGLGHRLGGGGDFAERLERVPGAGAADVFLWGADVGPAAAAVEAERAGAGGEDGEAAPVAEVVGAGAVGAGEVGDFVPRVAGGVEAGGGRGQEGGLEVLRHFGQLPARAAAGELRSRLEGQVVGAQVFRLERDGLRQRPLPGSGGLAGEGEDQVEVDVVEPRGPDGAEGLDDLGGGVDPFEEGELRGVERLRPHRHPRHAGVPVPSEIVALDRSRVRLHRDLPGFQAEIPRHTLQDRPDPRGRKQRRRAAADEDRVDRHRTVLLPDPPEILEKRFLVGLMQFAGGGVRVEVAVPAFSDAERDVDVEAGAVHRPSSSSAENTRKLIHRLNIHQTNLYG